MEQAEPPVHDAAHRATPGMGAALGVAEMDRAFGAVLRCAGADAREGSRLPSRRPSPCDGPIRVAILVDEGAMVVDFANPWEGLLDAGASRPACFELRTVAVRRDPVTSCGGLRIVPDGTLDDAPQPNVIVMGDQQGARVASGTTAARVEWIRRVAASADLVVAVGEGSFLLAQTGLLDGARATTHHRCQDAFEREFPRVRLVRDRSLVDEGKFVCDEGSGSGVDAALHVVAHYCGIEVARRTAAAMGHGGEGWLSARAQMGRAEVDRKD